MNEAIGRTADEFRVRTGDGQIGHRLPNLKSSDVSTDPVNYPDHIVTGGKGWFLPQPGIFSF
ncbi:MAG TPA: hypothetical protein VJ960_02110, partial [Oceanipulchritudo sp.]|nr:hypothetical protein [Oceanipulchritudo sp.]